MPILLMIAFLVGFFETILKTENERKCFARGAFLGGGSIADPQKSYQMEFVTAQQSLAEPLMNILKNVLLHLFQLQLQE